LARAFEASYSSQMIYLDCSRTMCCGCSTVGIVGMMKVPCNISVRIEMTSVLMITPIILMVFERNEG